MKRREGFTLVEMLVVIVVIGLLAGISVLKYIDLTRTAMAAQVVGEFTTIRLAAYNYEADNNNQWPAETGPGMIPDEMRPYLPNGFSFRDPLYTLDWDNFTGGGNAVYQVGITLTSSDAKLMNALIQNLGSKAPYYVAGNTMTYVIIDPSGNY